jgi:hypothetical protein
MCTWQRETQQTDCKQPIKHTITTLKTMKKLNSIVKITTLATVSLGALSVSSAAHAAGFTSFDLGKEGEVALANNNFACITQATCLQTQSSGFTVTSLAYNNINKPSLLFSDKRDTANTYKYKKGNTVINFFGENGPIKLDEGTNTPLGQFWLRPVGLDKNGKPLEKGRLEEGLFQFNFEKTVSKLVLNLFDVEYANSTKVMMVNGKLKSLAALAGADGNVQQLTLKNVKSFQIQLGQLGKNPDPKGVSFATGDGVSLQGTAVPEPGVNASLGALGLAAMFGLNRRRKAVKFN